MAKRDDNIERKAILAGDNCPECLRYVPERCGTCDQRHPIGLSTDPRIHRGRLFTNGPAGIRRVEDPDPAQIANPRTAEEIEADAEVERTYRAVETLRRRLSDVELELKGVMHAKASVHHGASAESVNREATLTRRIELMRSEIEHAELTHRHALRRRTDLGQVRNLRLIAWGEAQEREAAAAAEGQR